VTGTVEFVDGPVASQSVRYYRARLGP